MNIHDLTSMTGLPARQVRYLVSEGFMPSPTGGRSNAQYGDAHLQAIRRYLRLKDLGFPPAAIRRLLEAKAGAPFPIADGVTLIVAPELIGAACDQEHLLARTKELFAQIFQGEVQ